jgi:hypothetical protein
MKNRESFIFLTSVLGALGILISGCAGVPGAPRSFRQRTPHTVVLDLKTSSIAELSKQLSQIHSEQVILSTAALKTLLLNEKTFQNQCKNISSQLEALKTLDLEESGEP